MAAGWAIVVFAANTTVLYNKYNVMYVVVKCVL